MHHPLILTKYSKKTVLIEALSTNIYLLKIQFRYKPRYFGKELTTYFQPHEEKNTWILQPNFEKKIKRDHVIFCGEKKFHVFLLFQQKLSNLILNFILFSTYKLCPLFGYRQTIFKKSRKFLSKSLALTIEINSLKNN